MAAFVNLAEVKVAIGQADEDIMPEGRITVTVGSVQVFDHIADAADIAKLAGPMISLVAALGRRASK